MSTIDDPVAAGEKSFRAWSESITATPAGQAIYAEESEKMDLWLQLMETRQAAGLFDGLGVESTHERTDA